MPGFRENLVLTSADRSQKTSGVRKGERKALVAFFLATNGATAGKGWRRGAVGWHKKGWNSDIPVSDWHGVTVESETITRLELAAAMFMRGPLPLQLGDRKSLQKLRPAVRPLRRPIPPELGDLKSLQSLLLSYNQLSGPIPPELGDLKSLKRLDLSNNPINVPFTVEPGDVKSSQELHLLKNQLSGPIPPELGGLKSLLCLDLSDNKLSGPIPSELGELKSLQSLDLSSNQFSGPIPPELGELKSLQHLDLSENPLSGPIPSELGELKSLQQLNLSRNQLSGPIPPELGDLKSLRSLDLSSNQFSGPIPPELGELKSLQHLDLSENPLSGPIPPELGGLESLLRLGLSRTQLSGPIPPELGGLKSLQQLRLIGIDLSGPIPPELGELKSLQRLDLSSNQLSGPIPPELGDLKSLQRLDLSSNQLSGPIPPELGDLKSLQRLDLSGNQLSGPIPPELGELKSLQRLDLSRNQLSGPIPPELGELKSLQRLDLSRNQLSGPIPPELGELESLQELDLSRNQLSEYPALAAEKMGRLDSWRHAVGDNPWSRPPGDVVAQGGDAIVAWWRDIKASGSVKSSKVKVVLVGAGTAGKTSLTRALTGEGETLPESEERTIGVERRKTVRVADCFERHCPNGGVGKYLEERLAEEEARASIAATAQDLAFVMWDFAGQEAYFSHHQTFLTAHSLFVLVVDLPAFLVRHDEARAAGGQDCGAYDADFGHEQEISLWLSMLDNRVTDCHVVVVGTKTHGMTDKEKTLGQERLAEAVTAAAARLNRRREDFARKSKQNEESRLRSQQEQQRLEGDSADEMGSSVGAENVTSTGVTVLNYANDQQVAVLVDSKEESGIGEALMHFTRAVHGRKTAFPSVDASIPKSWGDAMDFLVGQSVTRSFVAWGEVVQEWQTLKETEEANVSLGKESPMLAEGGTKSKGGGTPEEVLLQAAHLLERQGTMLFTNEERVLHLKPERIIDLLKPIADHRITTEGTDFWRPRIEKYLRRAGQWSLAQTEQTWQQFIQLQDYGILHEQVLDFLWLTWTPIGAQGTGAATHQKEMKPSPLVAQRGLLSELKKGQPDAQEKRQLMRGWLVESGALYAQDDEAEKTRCEGAGKTPIYGVPYLLETWVDKERLKHAFDLSDGQKMTRCAITLPGQPFVPPGLMPRIVAACMRDAKRDSAAAKGSCRVILCWRYGVVLFWGAERVLVYHSKGSIGGGGTTATSAISFNNTYRNEVHQRRNSKAGSNSGIKGGGGGGGAVIEWCVLGENAGQCDGKSDEVVRPCILRVLKKDFSGLDFRQELPGVAKGNMKAALYSLQQHMDERLDVIESKVDRIVKATRGIESFIRVKDMPCPALAVLLPEGSKTTPSGNNRKGFDLFQKRAWDWAKGTVMRRYRLFFLCAHDLSVVPTGPDGKGYEVPMPKDWVKTAAPILKLSLMALKVATKIAVGTDLPVDGLFEALSDNAVDEMRDGMKEGIDFVSEYADDSLDDFMREEMRAINATPDGEGDGGDQQQQKGVFSRKDVDFGPAYEAYLAFLKAKVTLVDKADEDHHGKRMVLVKGSTDDAWAWVRKENKEEWERTHEGAEAGGQATGMNTPPTAANEADRSVGGGGGQQQAAPPSSSPSAAAAQGVVLPEAAVKRPQEEHSHHAKTGASTAVQEEDQEEGQDIRRWLQEVKFSGNRIDAVVELLVREQCDSLDILDNMEHDFVKGLLEGGAEEANLRAASVENFMYHLKQRKKQASSSSTAGFVKGALQSLQSLFRSSGEGERRGNKVVVTHS